MSNCNDYDDDDDALFFLNRLVFPFRLQPYPFERLLWQECRFGEINDYY